ncbi:tetratricopeptide repeat protein [Streptantibioticus rubrisoli]|uniref:Tetratricopeptide repeat protein n=1 Tax=Streptantibioticus rubrisoli TaxID=1387313 RepID=A0ABT1P834_9ACTN|nr:tetratricopeptide repeat protein [Streptantibioticus rubrisoli]MCQ4041510.1 tetratricopeptide repeat protein [Streptantibioticus rubrisoli]
MVEPVSLGAVSAMLGAAYAGMGNEAGKRATQLIGGLARRIVGREVTAPQTVSEREGLARQLFEGARGDDQHARALAELAALVHGTLSHPAVRRQPQLPGAVTLFSDRQEPMRQLDREASRKFDGRPRRVLLHGPEGIGSSALAVQWGWRELRRFPDGQLYVDLGGRALDAAVAVHRALSELGLSDEEVPPGLEDRTNLFRDLVTDLRLLVVLDHAHSAAQVGPLLASEPGVFTIVVAHRRLPGLDAVPIEVEPLSRKYAVQLLTDIAGRKAVDRARGTLPSVLARCAGSPYALWAVAPRLTAPPHEEAGSTMAVHDPVRTHAEDVYSRLSPDAALVYRRAALWPWPALSPAAAAAAAEVTESAAAGLLEELEALRLLEPVGSGRFRYRPAVRRHAEETAAREDGIADCRKAVRRTVEWYLDFAVRAGRAALRQSWRVGRAANELAPGDYPSPGEALAALVGELDNLVQAVLAAKEFELGDTACQLCEALWAAQLKDGRHEEVLPALRAAVDVAGQLPPGGLMAGRMHTLLAMALIPSRRFAEAETAARAAAEAERQADHLRGAATATETLGLVRLAQWRFHDAYELFTEADRILDGIGEDDLGFADVPRARALLRRHRGRALRGLDNWAESEEELTAALGFFRETQEPYNTARTLTDLAETYVLAGRRPDALPLIDEAIDALVNENAHYHVAHLRALRESCVSEPNRSP